MGQTWTDRYEVEGVAFIGRTFEEYARFFDLDPAALEGRRVLDCPAGPSGFVAGATARGATAMGVDPVFQAPPDELAARQQSAVDNVAAELPEKAHLFTWEFYDDVEDRLRYLRRAGRRSCREIRDSPGRYVAGALPNLPFADDAFDLVCSANFLFLYSDRFDRDFHLAAMRDLLRVAREVRVFPTVGLDTERSPHLDPVCEVMERAGHDVDLRTVPYEFQQGADEMLVVSRRD